MSSPPKTEGRRLKAFRLSDVPIEVRLRAAQKCADEETRRAEDPLEAIFETVKINAVAEDPVTAAETMAADCRNEIHFISLDEWEKATNPRRRW